MGNSFGWRRDRPHFRDHLFAVPTAVLRALPPPSDLRSGMPPVWDQGELGSCTGHGVGALVEYDWKRQKLPDYTPSRLFLYYQAGVMEGSINEDAGAEIRDVMKGVAKFGACHEHEWAYDISKFAVKP